jgi:DNA adenine methylase
MTDIVIPDTSSPSDQALTPFLKWAGGKRWFVNRCLHMVPEQYGRYIEPFLGSGAMYFALKPACALLADLNPDLIDCYQAIRSSPAAIVELLALHHEQHCHQHYYATRAIKPTDPVERAAWMIYLNRTCWNGLYRVNRKNEFNVPIGTKTNVVLPNDDFVSMSRMLAPADICHQDFETTLDAAESGDFVFVDPPYTVKHNLNGFLKYNDKIFSWADQVRLRDAVVRAAQRGALVLVTNANHQSIRDLYEGVGTQEVIERASVLSGSAQHRVRTEELVIRTWITGNSSVSANSDGPRADLSIHS